MKNLTIRNKALKTDKLLLTVVSFKTQLSKTSIVETALAIAAQQKNHTVTTIAKFIVNTFKADDCFHKRESNKSKDTLKSTVLRVRHHVKDTLKAYALTEKLYTYDSATDSVSFTEKFQTLVKSDKTYRSHIRYMQDTIKSNYTVKKADKKVKSA